MMTPRLYLHLIPMLLSLACVSITRGEDKPSIEHRARDVEGWTVQVDVRLLEGTHADTGKKALRILANKLYEIAEVVPADRVVRLREVPIWLDLDHALGNLQYHPSVGWLRKNGHDPAMAKAVHIPRADRLISLTRRNVQPWVMLHELAHAYHDRVLGFDHPPIVKAFDRIAGTKKLERVLHIGGRKSRHYALTDHKEFFAEMTEAYFGTNDFYPFVRAELKEAAPDVYALLEEIWRKPKPEPKDKPLPASALLPERPNVVLILIDDMGWSDLACQGNKRLDTPHIDDLARQGMRFTDAYAAAPVCSPTRAAILTGQAPARLRLTNHISNRDFTPDGAKLLPAETRTHLPLEHVTLAERLKGAGYATAFLGKWHLAGVPGAKGKGLTDCYPEKQGFDLNLGGCAHGGPPTYFDPYRIHNLPDRRRGEYLPDRLADEAVGFLRKERDKPFFLALWTYTVHWPMEAPAGLITKYEKRLGPGLKDARYGAMIEALDGAVARVFKELSDRGLDKNTLVIFTSDNGGFLGVADNRPLRSGKGFLYEGGLRVPLIVRWPGVVKPGSVSHTPVVSTDLYPTILEAAGLKPTPGVPLDGESLLPVLKGEGELRRKALHFHYPNYAWHRSNRLGGVIREGKYKLIERYGTGDLELYDLAADLGEKENLAERLPEKATALRESLWGWLRATDAAMPTPRE